MHHLEIEIDEKEARLADAAKKNALRRELWGDDWDEEPDDDKSFDFGEEAVITDNPKCWSFDLSEFAKAFSEILDGADREANALDRTAGYYLEAAASEMADRAASRDADDGERSMARAVVAFNAIYGHDLTETEGWQFMSILKKSRSAEGAYHEDDHTDDVAYSALAAESAWEEK